MPLSPAFPAEIFKTRRAEVLRRMLELSPGPSVAVFPATPVATRNHDVEHPYRAESDLFWLTGFEEPETVAVLSTETSALIPTFWLTSLSTASRIVSVLIVLMIVTLTK